MKRNIFKIVLTLGYIITGFNVIAQMPTIGLLFSDENVSEGYTLFYSRKEL